MNLDGRRYAHTLQALAIDPDIFDCEQQQAASDEECGGGKDRASVRVPMGSPKTLADSALSRLQPMLPIRSRSQISLQRVHSMPVSRPGAISHRASSA